MGIYAQQASARLHKHHRQARVLSAWAMTSHFNANQSHSPAVTVALRGPTSDPLLLTRAAKELLPQILDGVRYARAGVVVTDLRPVGARPTFDPFVNQHEAKEIGPLITADQATAWDRRGGPGPGGPEGRPAVGDEAGDDVPALHHALGRITGRQGQLTT